MQINLSIENPDLPKYKCLALGVFADERPPRGICGFIDWRLNGMISREMLQGRIGGDFEEKIIIPYPGRIGAEMLLLFGLGSIYEINYDRLYNAAFSVTQAIDGMSLQSFAFDIYGAGRANLITPNIVEAMITGVFDFLSSDIQKIAGMDACIVTSAKYTADVSLGIRQFKSNVNDKESVDVSAMQSSFAQS